MKETNLTLKDDVINFLDDCSYRVGCYEENQFHICNWLNINHFKILSPIEQILYISLKTVARINEIKDEDNLGLKIFPQYSIGQYIIDFKIDFITKKNIQTVLIECDGYDFHDTNKKQRAYEKSRDRFLQKQGYKVFHYTGSEIVKNNLKIACEIISQICDIEEEELFGQLENYNG